MEALADMPGVQGRDMAGVELGHAQGDWSQILDQVQRPEPEIRPGIEAGAMEESGQKEDYKYSQKMESAY